MIFLITSYIILSMNKYIFAYTTKNEGDANNYLDVNNATINYISTTSLPAAMPKGRNDYSLIIVYGGKVKLTEADGDKYLDSHCIIYKPFQPHNYTYIACPDSEIYCCHFKGVFVEAILNDLNLNEHYYFKINKTPAIAQIVKQLIASLKTKEKGYKTRCSCNLLRLFTILSENSAFTDTSLFANSTKVQPAINAIMQDASQFKTIKELASLCNVSESTFVKIFTKTIGEAPITYLNRKKLENSIFFLLESDYSINEIATNVGYDSQFYYSNRFKQIYGLSPLQYRKKYTDTGSTSFADEVIKKAPKKKNDEK